MGLLTAAPELQVEITAENWESKKDRWFWLANKSVGASADDFYLSKAEQYGVDNICIGVPAMIAGGEPKKGFTPDDLVGFYVHATAMGGVSPRLARMRGERFN